MKQRGIYALSRSSFCTKNHGANGYQEPSLADPFGAQDAPPTSEQKLAKAEVEEETVIDVAEEITGLGHFSKSLEFINKRDYKNADLELKKSLKEIKDKKQDKSLVYLHVLNKLAYVNFLSQKMPQAERYFTICKDMVTKIPDVQDNGFAFHNSLLEFYLNTNLSKAKEMIDNMLEMDFTAQNLKRTRFSLGNYYLLNKEFEKSSSEYRSILKMVPDERLKGFVFNNMNISDIRLSEKEGITEAKQTDFVNIFKESISILEDIPQIRATNPATDIEKEISEEILDFKTVIPSNYSVENGDRYTGVFKNRDSGRVITNMVEFLLFHSKTPSDISFWFKIGLDFHQNVAPEKIDRFLTYLAVFYSSNQQVSVAEKIFREALTKMEKDFSYTKAMGLNMYGRMLLKHPKRKVQAYTLLKQSERLMSILPYWYDNFENIFTMENIE
ncbi:unnamed protein product [Moneuplotes crassus]|uniref:Uncharacterized protein n=1 Tax=Euplotes crassus TaxID=5936 RepID=A0AAD1UHX0_EUPCR|nr:unnamed protein product [Moneuplotes crassus]